MQSTSPMSQFMVLQNIMSMEALFGILAVLTPVVVVYILVQHAKRCEARTAEEPDDSRFS